MSTQEDIPVVDAEPVDNKQEHEEEEMKEEDGLESSCDSELSNEDLASEFLYSFGHGFVQAPIDGVREIVNTLSGTKVVPKVEVMKRPDKKEIATPAWQAQKIGAGCGLVASVIVITNLITRGRPI